MRGVAKDVGSARGVRLACYCRDCQAFASFLERADELLDAHGGTEVYQLSPSRIELTHGHEHLACMRLSPKGLLRWYAGCCRTPIGNTMARPKVPFIGLISTSWDSSLDAKARDALLGPLRARINGPGRPSEDGSMVSIDRFPLGTIGHSLRMLARGWLRGEHRPTPLFDLETGMPRATPRVLGPDERRLLAG